MSDTVFEYTDAQGGVHQVSSLSQVPKDRLRHMLVIGSEEPGRTSAGAPVAPPPPAPKQLPPAVWAVSGALLLGAFMFKNFLVRVLCGATAVLFLLYHGWDIFASSGYMKVEDRKPKPPVVAPTEE